MSRKSILRVVRRTLAPARASRADETDSFAIVTPSPERLRDHQHSAIRCSTQPKTTGFDRGVRKVTAIQGDGIQEDGHRGFERDAALLRVGGSLPRDDCTQDCA
jgi:hypothetical protein